MSEKLIETLVESRDIEPVITASEAIENDRYTIHDVGVPEELLMESAGATVARHAMRVLRARSNSTILVFVGPGNNGADAIVSCRYLLACGFRCKIFLVGDEARFSHALRYQIGLLKNALLQTGLDQTQWFPREDFASAVKENRGVIIIDGIFGAGLSRAPSGRALDAINFINSLRASCAQHCAVISVDVPSGLSLEAVAVMHACVNADVTVTFGQLKRVHISEPTKNFCGLAVTAPIGLFKKSPPSNFFRRKKHALLSLFKPLNKTDHKGKFGHTLIFEGCETYLGASRLAARAALRVGAGLVTIACDQSLLPTLLDVPEFMKIRRDMLSADFMSRVDAVIIGPGLSADDSWQLTARDFLDTWKDKFSVVVLDADGLRILSSEPNVFRKSVVIATPHPKEASMILGTTAELVEHDRFSAIEALGHKSNVLGLKIIWVLKGATTLVRSLDGNIFAFRGEVPLLATGGSGDVLSGAIAGLVKQTHSPLAATLLAVSIHIESAARLSQRIKKGSFATELADIFPIVTRHRL